MPHKPIKPLMISLEDELALEERALRAEQEWFLNTQVRPGLQAIKKALQACQEAVRLQEDAKGALTLAISSPNNDILKGFVTLAGSFIVKGELTIKLPKLAAVKVAIHSQIPSNASAPSSSTGILATTTGASESIVVTGAPTNTEMASSEEETMRAAAAPPAVSLATAEGSNISKSDEDGHQQVNAQGSHQAIQQALDSLPQTTATAAANASGTATPPATATPRTFDASVSIGADQGRPESYSPGDISLGGLLE
ncbi:hypothetical protein BGX34_007436 [Mortierella sp. NVP85]|nr:hypothetical protein BGX34_007436 [Mortierella sp. NVP85]